MILCFDLDNVICVTKNKVYKKAKPITKTIKLINQAYELGFIITIFTGRFYGKCAGNLKRIIEMDRGLTRKQLKKWVLVNTNVKIQKNFLTI
jgi:hydroxymethylpyrimidine pyrophosphatase-like HAD family hydrolase